MDIITLILTLLIIALPTILFIQKIRKHKELALIIDRLPGPKNYPIVGTTWEIIKEPMSRFFEIYHGRCVSHYPGPFRSWVGMQPTVHLMKAEHIERIVNNSTHNTKSLMYRFIEPWLGTGLLTSSGAKWHSHRKLITPTFHFKILDVFVDVFLEKSLVMVELLRSKANGTTFDVYPYITRCALDIICETAMGVEINAQNNTDSEYVKAIYDFSDLAVKRHMTPWLHSDFIWYKTADGKRYRRCIEILHGFSKKVIQDRKVARQNGKIDQQIQEDDDMGKKKKLAFLDLLLEARLNGQGLTDDEIREETDTFMFEGHDTTTAGISWSLFMLGNNPEAQERVHQELDDIFLGSDRPTTKQDINDMKYLEMVIKETLRLYPSVPFIGRQLGADTEIGGHIIPKNVQIALHIYECQRDPDHFPEPNRFNPDNFLPEAIAKRHPYAFMPFSAGARNCVGQKFAILEEKVMLASILRNYTVKSVESVEECKIIGVMILRPANGVKITLVPRK